MKRIILLCLCTHLGLQLHAQDTLKLTQKEAEALFLQNNLLLISEKLNIDSEQAAVIQANTWHNPEFSISEVNLWKNSTVDPSPAFFGHFGRNRQIAFEFNQLVQTAGKRAKLVALETVDVSKAEQQFENLLRGLKLELRNSLTELLYVQQVASVHQHLADHISLLTSAYQNQLNQGHISKNASIQLKAKELEINKAILELYHQSNDIQSQLNLLLGIPSGAVIELIDTESIISPKANRAITFEETLERAKDNRPDYRLARLAEDYANKLLQYEKSKRLPDVKFGVNYDRNGATMLDFVGVGVSFDLPFFDRNKAGIKQAQVQIEQSRIHKQQKAQAIENEIFSSYTSFQQSLAFLNKIDADYEADLDMLLENYTKNFTSKNVNILEYLHFLDAYLNNKTIILEARKRVNQTAEELNYSLGIDF